MAKPRAFQLKRSRIALAFQCLIFMILLALLYAVVNPVLWLICAVLGLMSYVLFRKRADLLHLEHLDADDWSVLYRQSSQVLQLQLHQVIDHQLYIVLYFQGSKIPPIVIWCDQLTVPQWKSLKQLALLNH